MLRSGFSWKTRSVTVTRFGFFQDSRIRVNANDVDSTLTKFVDILNDVVDKFKVW